MKTRTWIVGLVVIFTVLVTVVVYWTAAIRKADWEYAAYTELLKKGATGDDWVGFQELLTGRPPVVQLRIPASISKDDAFRCLQHMHNLEGLELAYGSLTEAELAILSRLRLDSLRFSGDYPTDKAVNDLLSLLTVRFLDLPSGNLSENSIRRLRKALPRANVETH